MIRLVHGGSPSDPSFDAMFVGRAQVFVDRLGWPLVVGEDGREIDQFDALDPLYLMAHDRTGQLAGSMRLMPTTGPTLLTEVFLDTFDEPVDVRSAMVWEATRFCIHPGAREATPTRMNRATAELCQGLAEVGLMAGLSHIIGIYEDRMRKVYDRIGWRPECLATSRAGHPTTLHVGLWEVSEAALAIMRAHSGVIGTVLETEAAFPLVRAA